MAMVHWPVYSRADPAERFLGMLVGWVLNIVRVLHGMSRRMVLGLCGCSIRAGEFAALV